MITARAALLIPAMTGALLSAACGSGTSTGPGASATPAATTVAVSDSARFCTVVKKNLKLVSGSQLPTLLTGGSPKAWKAYLSKATSANAELVSAAPADLRPAVQALKAAGDAIETALAASGYETSKVNTTKLIRALNSPERIAASTKLTAYVKTNCGLDLSKPPT